MQAISDDDFLVRLDKIVYVKKGDDERKIEYYLDGIDSMFTISLANTKDRDDFLKRVIEKIKGL